MVVMDTKFPEEIFLRPTEVLKPYFQSKLILPLWKIIIIPLTWIPKSLQTKESLMASSVSLNLLSFISNAIATLSVALVPRQYDSRKRFHTQKAKKIYEAKNALRARSDSSTTHTIGQDPISPSATWCSNAKK